MYPQPQSRLCEICKMTRIPERSVVTKNGKKWFIYKCTICKAQDIEPYVKSNIRLWKDGKFQDLTETEENDTPFNS